MKNDNLKFKIFPKILNFAFYIVILIFAFYTFNLKAVYSQAANYPIKELGNCRDQKECSLYCQIPSNTPACWSYGKYVLPKVLGEQTMSVTFPVPELGNCKNFGECYNYCNNPQNQTACLDFAQKHGLMPENTSPGLPTGVDKMKIIESAKNELGCASETECKKLCSLPENFSRCSSFAQKHNLETPKPDNKTEEVISNAKQELGCDSESSCKSLCEKPENRDECISFGKKHGMDQENNGLPPPQIPKDKQNFNKNQEGQKGPGGCDSEDSCKQYCVQHPEECQGFGPPGGGINNNLTPGQPVNPAAMMKGKIPENQSYLGPSGCKTEEECKNYCQDHPNQCPGFPQPMNGYPPVQMNKGNPPPINSGGNPPPPQGFNNSNNYPPPEFKPQEQNQNNQPQGFEQKPPPGTATP